MIHLPIGEFIMALWLLWGGYWWISSRGVKRDAREEGRGARLRHILPIALAAALVAWPQVPAQPAWLAWLGQRVLPRAAWQPLVGLALLVAGLALAVWARRVLGRNWSAWVTLKQEHELVQDGPYRVVRHPIYAGLILGFVGTAIARDELRGLLAVALVACTFIAKLRLEQRWLREQFGVRYEEYCRRTWALLPGLY